MSPASFFCLAVAASSGLTFLVYGWDKWRAVRGRSRVPERRLILLAALLGFPGAWTAVLVFRHKTRKPSFLLPLTAATAVDVALVWIAIERFGGT